MASFDLGVAGVTFRRKAVEEFIAFEGDKEITFEREKDNKYDENAIKVLGNGEHIGYIPATLAQMLAPKMDNNEITLSCIKHEEGHFVPKNRKKEQPFVRLTVELTMV